MGRKSDECGCECSCSSNFLWDILVLLFILWLFGAFDAKNGGASVSVQVGAHSATAAAPAVER